MPDPLDDALRDLLTGLISERERQDRQFQTLDTKGGVLLGFAAAFTALAAGLDHIVTAAAVLVGGLAALAALAALRPRRLAIADPHFMRDHVLNLPGAQARRLLIDKHAEVLTTNREALDAKAIWVAVSTILLGLATVVLAAGTVLQSAEVLP